MRSWVVSSNWDTPPLGYVSRGKAAEFLLRNSNTQLLARSMIKKVFGTGEFTIYRGYSKETPSRGLKSYSISKKAARGFQFIGRELNSKIVTYKDIVAIPAMAFADWSEREGFDNEMEVAIEL